MDLRKSERFNLYSTKNPNFSGLIRAIGALILVFLFCNRHEMKNPFPPIPPIPPIRGFHDPGGVIVIRRIMEQVRVTNSSFTAQDPKFCTGLFESKGFEARCEYLSAHPECSAGGFFDYERFFYCTCGKFTSLGYIMLGLWLIVLFYLLGNTAADYFCCSLEKLSTLLRLSPALAGVALLPLGNGAPDVFASIAAFVGKNTGDVGLNSVLGGAVFVICIVVGVISICVSERGVQVDRKCFIRDVCFFLFILVSLGLILVLGEVSVLVAFAYVSIYLVYAFFVAANEVLWKYARKFSGYPLLPVKEEFFSVEKGEGDSIYAALLKSDKSDSETEDVPCLEKKLPHWMWSSNVAVYANESANTIPDSPEWGWNHGKETDNDGNHSRSSRISLSTCCRILSILEAPLILPRRLTIPIVEEERWSKSYGVASCTLAPILLAFLWYAEQGGSPLSGITAYLIGVLVGATFGILAYLYTKTEHPPRKFTLPWVLGGFFMSIVWFYIVANELVAVLVSLGVIFGINPSILGLTVLAWGNSMGDLMSNVALAMHGGDSVQIAMSGCYAGPMFNLLAGLGISMLLGGWSSSPVPYTIPRDYSLFTTLGFLVAGLLWSLVVLPRNGMRPSKVLGVGLIVIYAVFLVFRVSSSFGVVSFGL